MSKILLDSDIKAETALVKAYRPSDQERVYLDNVARKLSSATVMQGNLSEVQKQAFASSVVRDVLKGLGAYNQGQDLDGQMAAFDRAVQMFKPYKGTDQDWLWQNFLLMAKNFRPIVQEDTMGGANGIKDFLGLGPDRTFNPTTRALGEGQ